MDEMKEKEVLKLDMETNINFEPVGDIKITSTNELGKVINDIFSRVFKDYCGCSLQAQFVPDRGYVIVPKLYFTVLKKDQYNDEEYFAFKTLEANPASDIVGRVQRLAKTSATAGVKVAITEDGKSVLEDFVITPNVKSQAFDWNSAYNVIATSTETFIEVYKFDILKIISFIYGSYDANGSKMYYQITPTGVIGGQNQYRKMDNWSLNIIRLNQSNNAKAAELLGFGIINQGVGPNMITETTFKHA